MLRSIILLSVAILLVQTCGSWQLDDATKEQCNIGNFRALEALARDELHNVYRVGRKAELAKLHQQLQELFQGCRERLGKELELAAKGLSRSDGAQVRSLWEQVKSQLSNYNDLVLDQQVEPQELLDGLAVYVRDQVPANQLDGKQVKKELDLVFKLCSTVVKQLEPAARVFDMLVLDEQMTSFIERPTRDWIREMRLCRILNKNEGFIRDKVHEKLHLAPPSALVGLLSSYFGKD